MPSYLPVERSELLAGLLRVGLERVSVGYPITENFERYLLHAQKQGKLMLSFVHEGGDQFQIYFGEVGDGDLNEKLDLMNIDVAPWQVYIFNPVKPLRYHAGDLVHIFRKVDDYEHVISPKDPIQIVDLATNTILGEGVVMGTARFSLSQVDDAYIATYFGPRATTVAQVRQIISAQYEVPPQDVDVVVVLGVIASTEIQLDTRPLVKTRGRQRVSPRSQSLVARLVARMIRSAA